MSNQTIQAILNVHNVYAMAKTFLYAADVALGDDIGEHARAVALIALRAAIKKVDADYGDPGFDAKASLNALVEADAARR